MSQESRNAGKGLRDSEITQQIIAAAIRVHRALGPGFLELVNEEALAVEFALSGIQFVRQYPVLVEGKIVVELKAVSRLEDIHLIGRSYLKAISLEDGLLFNFATSPLTIKPFCRERAKSASPDLLA
jgi:PD-(D/E)XK nuclease superfamily